MVNLFWAIAPTITLLIYYYRRMVRRFVLLQTFGFFCVGIFSAVLALQLLWGLESTLIPRSNWEAFSVTFIGAITRQFLIVAPVEELCKFIAFISLMVLYKKAIEKLSSTANYSSPREIFLYAIAICLGFTTHENWLFLSHGNGTPLDRIISTPVHTIFAAPWIYAITRTKLKFHLVYRHQHKIIIAWSNCVVVHGLTNIFANASNFSIPTRYLSYCLFPFLLYLLWRMERLVQQVEAREIRYLIKYFPLQHRYWRLGLILFALILGGNAILGLFITIKVILPLPASKIWEFPTITLLIGRIFYNLVFGLMAAGIYFYLQKTAKSRKNKTLNQSSPKTENS